jgi:hypothetical protein
MIAPTADSTGKARVRCDSEGKPMANLKHLNRLKRGVKQWNHWRLNNHISPDLNGADLGGMKLEGADLSRADLTESDLQSADLSGVDFDHASLKSANLRGANCTGADFLQAFLANADFTSADLTNADMTETDMSEIDFSFANLSDLNLDNAFIWGSTFRNNDLKTIRNLHTLQHQGPSSIDLDTIFRSEGKIPVEFLRDVGLPEDFIQYFRSQDWKSGYPSCFISYSSKDQGFVSHLHASLQQAEVRCWLATEDLRIGDHFAERIEESIRGFDKLLLVLSKDSVGSSWVEREVAAAFEKEQRSRAKKNVLVPIRLDDTVMRTKKSWAAAIRRKRHIGDFQCSLESESFEKALQRLLRDLKLNPDTKCD